MLIAFFSRKSFRLLQKVSMRKTLTRSPRTSNFRRFARLRLPSSSGDLLFLGDEDSEPSNSSLSSSSSSPSSSSSDSKSESSSESISGAYFRRCHDQLQESRVARRCSQRGPPKLSAPLGGAPPRHRPILRFCRRFHLHQIRLTGSGALKSR